MHCRASIAVIPFRLRFSDKAASYPFALNLNPFGMNHLRMKAAFSLALVFAATLMFAFTMQTSGAADADLRTLRAAAIRQAAFAG